MKTTWKKWRIGLWITVAIAVLSSIGGLTTDMNLKQFLALMGSTLSTGIVTYLMKSPLQDVADAEEETTGSRTLAEIRPIVSELNQQPPK